MTMPDTEGEDLAQLLYQIYQEAFGKSLWTWQGIRQEERTAWIMVAQHILAGYEVKQEPDHR